MNADHTELLARLYTAGNKWALQNYWSDINDAAAAIRSLQAQLEDENYLRESAQQRALAAEDAISTERKAREVVEAQCAEMEGESFDWQKRATTAEASASTIFGLRIAAELRADASEAEVKRIEAETIERCATCCHDQIGLHAQTGYSHGQLLEAADRIRALAPDRTAAAQEGTRLPISPTSPQSETPTTDSPTPAAATPSAPFIVTETANGTAAAPTLGKFYQTTINAKAEALRLEQSLHSTQDLLAASEIRWQRDIEIVRWACIEICRNLGADAAADAIRRESPTEQLVAERAAWNRVKP